MNQTKNKYSILTQILLIFTFLSCATNETKKDEEQKVEFVSEQKNTGNLLIEFKNKDTISIPNFTLRLSKKNPKNKWDTILTTGVLIPVPTDVYAYAVIYNSDFSKKFNLKTNESYTFVLPEGEYYASIDTVQNKDFSFRPMESQLFLFTFGYQSEKYSVRGKIQEYNSNCESYYTGNFDSVTSWNSSACGKIIIKKNKTSRIEVQVSDRNRTNGFIFFMKTIGIFFLAPFNNIFGYYNYRNYDVQLFNPDSDTINARGKK